MLDPITISMATKPKFRIADDPNGVRKIVFDVVDTEGRSLQNGLLKAGFAWAVEPDSELAKLQAEAKAAKRGLWADEDAVPPWEWSE